MKSVHVISAMVPKDPETRRRHRLAAETWRNLYSNGVIPCHVSDSDLPRNSTLIGDHRGLPFFKDLISFGIKENNPEVVIYSNADICVSTDCVKKISDRLLSSDAVISYRMDFPKIESPIPDNLITTGNQEPYGIDFFAFKVSWWDKYQKHMPDMLIGTERWDIILMNLILITCPPNCIVPNITYHESHDAFWKNKKNRFSSKAQFYNLTISRGIYEKTQLLAYLRKISVYPEGNWNFPIKYEVDSLDTQGGLSQLL